MSQRAIETKKPSSQPAPELKNLDVLIGKWNNNARFKNDPENTGTGWDSFEWMDGGYFLIERFDHKFTKHGAHRGTCIIGYDAASQKCLGYFFDNGGNARIYEISADERLLTIKGKWERFTGVISDDGRTIKGTWEQSTDGWNWKYLCDEVKTKQ